MKNQMLIILPATILRGIFCKGQRIRSQERSIGEGDVECWGASGLLDVSPPLPVSWETRLRMAAFRVRAVCFPLTVGFRGFDSLIFYADVVKE